jgi:hypothetical protein
VAGRKSAGRARNCEVANDRKIRGMERDRHLQLILICIFDLRLGTATPPWPKSKVNFEIVGSNSVSP